MRRRCLKGDLKIKPSDVRNIAIGNASRALVGDVFVLPAKYKRTFCENCPLNSYNENVGMLRRCLKGDLKIKHCGMRYIAIRNASRALTGYVLYSLQNIRGRFEKIVLLTVIMKILERAEGV